MIFSMNLPFSMTLRIEVQGDCLFSLLAVVDLRSAVWPSEFLVQRCARNKILRRFLVWPFRALYLCILNVLRIRRWFRYGLTVNMSLWINPRMLRMCIQHNGGVNTG